jgi:hypothetical protein
MELAKIHKSQDASAAFKTEPKSEVTTGQINGPETVPPQPSGSS